MSAAGALLVVGDLFFLARLKDTLARVGIISRSARTDDGLAQVLDGDVAPELFVVELGMRSLDAVAAIGTIRGRLPGAKIIAFAGHTSIELMESAKQAGGDRVVTNGEISAGLVSLVRDLGVVTDG